MYFFFFFLLACQTIPLVVLLDTCGIQVSVPLGKRSNVRDANVKLTEFLNARDSSACRAAGRQRGLSGYSQG